MRVIVDSGFPASVAQMTGSAFEVLRWTDGSADDQAFLREARTVGAHVVLFLGTRPLYSSDLLERALKLRLWVGGTQTTDPVDAQRALGNNANALKSLRGMPDRVIVLLARSMRLEPHSEFRTSADRNNAAS